MGPENSGGLVVAYLDGHAAEIKTPLPEITLKSSAGDTAGDMAAAQKTWMDFTIETEAEADGILELFRTIERSAAIKAARIFEPKMFHRYLHAKKKRTRKKYEKRILAWFREVLG